MSEMEGLWRFNEIVDMPNAPVFSHIATNTLYFEKHLFPDLSAPIISVEVWSTVFSRAETSTWSQDKTASHLLRIVGSVGWTANKINPDALSGKDVIGLRWSNGCTSFSAARTRDPVKLFCVKLVCEDDAQSRTSSCSGAFFLTSKPSQTIDRFVEERRSFVEAAVDALRHGRENFSYNAVIVHKETDENVVFTNDSTEESASTTRTVGSAVAHQPASQAIPHGPELNRERALKYLEGLRWEFFILDDSDDFLTVLDSDEPLTMQGYLSEILEKWRDDRFSKVLESDNFRPEHENFKKEYFGGMDLNVRELWFIFRLTARVTGHRVDETQENLTSSQLLQGIRRMRSQNRADISIGNITRDELYDFGCILYNHRGSIDFEDPHDWWQLPREDLAKCIRSFQDASGLDVDETLGDGTAEDDEFLFDARIVVETSKKSWESISLDETDHAIITSNKHVAVQLFNLMEREASFRVSTDDSEKIYSLPGRASKIVRIPQSNAGCVKVCALSASEEERLELKYKRKND